MFVFGAPGLGLSDIGFVLASALAFSFSFSLFDFHGASGGASRRTVGTLHFCGGEMIQEEFHEPRPGGKGFP